jgi:hypothetical protein
MDGAATNRTRWDRFSSEEFSSEHPGVAFDAAELDEILAAGRADADEVLAAVAPWLAVRDTAIEIGAGKGRTTIPMASEFDAVLAVDISSVALAELAKNCEIKGVHNVRTLLAEENWDRESSADLVYSRRTFPLVETMDEIASYFSRIRTALKAEGIGYLHFDTRPRTLAYHVRERTPDPLLPRQWRRGIRRIRRSREQLLALLERRGLRLVGELGANTVWNIFLVRPYEASSTR